MIIVFIYSIVLGIYYIRNIKNIQAVSAISFIKNLWTSDKDINFKIPNYL